MQIYATRVSDDFVNKHAFNIKFWVLLKVHINDGMSRDPFSDYQEHGRSRFVFSIKNETL